MKNIAYHHIHLTDRPSIWSTIFIEQMKYLEDSGLDQELDVIRVRAITQDDARNQMFKNLCYSYKARFEIEFIKNRFNNDEEMMYHRNSEYAFSEDVTLAKMFDDAHKFGGEYNILYFHSKGSTSFYKHLSPIDIQKQKQYYYWRQLMNWGVLERWRDCVEALKKFDTAGANYLTEPSPHYCGNFWWTKASHIRKLPNPSQKEWWEGMKHRNPALHGLVDRMRDEMWVCSLPETNSYDIVELPQMETFSACLTKSKYEACLKRS